MPNFQQGAECLAMEHLLFDSEIENVVSALKVKKDKIESKGIKSIRSRVANISEFLDEKMTIEEFREILLKYF